MGERAIPDNFPGTNTRHPAIPFWHDPDRRAVVYQIATLVIVGLISFYLFNNTVTNLKRQSIATGFDFLEKEAAFEIGESLIAYSAANSYARALLAGLLNTIKVAIVGILFSVLLGVLIGVSRLSTNWIVSRLAAIYIEVFQDIPVLIQLLFWYAIFYDSLPGPRQALSPFAGVFLCNRGLVFGIPSPHPAHGYMAVALFMACIGVFFLHRWARNRQDKTGQIFPIVRVGAGLILGLPLLAWLVGGSPTAMNVPQLTGFNFTGGVNVSPEFTALLLGLVLYTAAFVAEIVRAGIQAVSRGQTEAALSLGLKPSQTLNRVILPQALRVIIPPLTSQMLNLTKNSSLAVAIGYPDFVSVANTTINQTGQAIEGVAMIMLVYLIMSLLTSFLMNIYNKKMALVER
ncbi:MAG: amino acid ABC transporter permease [Desulfatirhabdiaceae bacterium]